MKNTSTLFMIRMEICLYYTNIYMYDLYVHVYWGLDLIDAHTHAPPPPPPPPQRYERKVRISERQESVGRSAALL